MTGIQLFFVVAILLATLGATLVTVRGKLQSLRHAARRAALIRNMLEKAQEQNEIFDLNIQDKHGASKGLPATLTRILPDALEMEILAYVSREAADHMVEVYFRATVKDGPSFFKFFTTIKSVTSHRQKSIIVLSMPTDIDAGQKRHFIRVTPPKDLVRVIGLWKMDAAAPMPRSTAEIGSPMLHFTAGMETEPVRVADISATGMALRFPAECLDVKPVDLDKGSQLLCLIIYQVSKEDRMVTFWCTCDVLNSRMRQDPEPAMILGTEFTNWAVLEPGKAEINWFHSTPKSGVSPITQWVMQMDMQQRKFTG